MYWYVNRSVFIQKRKFKVSTLSGFKVMIQNVHVQFLFCSSIYTIESVLPVCDKHYHMNNEFQQMWAEIKNVWNHALLLLP